MAKHGESPGRSSETVRVAEHGSLPAIHLSCVKLIKEAIAFAIEHGDNCQIPENYASANGYGDDDWLSDWGAFLADHVIEELKARGFTILPRAELDPTPISKRQRAHFLKFGKRLGWRSK